MIGNNNQPAANQSQLPATLTAHQVPAYSSYQEAHDKGWDGLQDYQKPFDGIAYLSLGETSKGRCCLIAFPTDGGAPIKMSSRVLTVQQMNTILGQTGKSDKPYRVQRDDKGVVTIVAA